MVKKWLSYLVLLLTIASGSELLGKSLLSTLTVQQKKKIDPVLQMVLDEPSQSGTRLMKPLQQYGHENLWPVLIKTHRDPSEVIERLGGFVGSQHGMIYTAYLPVTGIAELSRQPFVDYIEGGRMLKREMDTSLPRNGGSFVHQIPPGIRGKGVIIGITDSGIDLSHPDFRDENGNSRVLFLWDQYAAGSPRPAGFSYGREYTREELNSGILYSKDTNGHGTRVAGIAAGNGRAGGFTGVAPEADLIIVKARGGMISNIIEDELSTVGLLDAYAYIRQKAQSLGKPFVINTSRGTTIGPHDGTTLLSQAVNAEVAAGAIIVVSAGNYSNDDWHAQATAKPGIPITFQAHVGSKEKSIYVDFWYETNDAFQVEIAGPSGIFTTPLFGDSVKTFYMNDARIKIVSVTHSPLNNDNEFLVYLYNPLDGSEIAPGTWTFRFLSLEGNTLPDGGEIDGWIIRDVDAYFTKYVDRTETIGELASTDSVISVASFNNKTSPSGRISDFSSYGPRRDDVLKPDIAAAGGGVVSSRSQQSDSSPYQGNSYYAYGSGTSYSAPHVAGAVALLLQLDPNLRATQVKRILQETARSDGFTGQTPNVKWGYGKLDILAIAMRYLSDVTVSGNVTQNGSPVPGQVIMSPLVSGYEELVRVDTVSSSGEYELSVFPGAYNLTVIPEFPYSSFVTRLDLPYTMNSVEKDIDVDVAAIMLIDDDGGDNYETFIAESLDSLEMPFSRWEEGDAHVAPLRKGAAVTSYPIAIWFTGDAEDSVLTKAERDTIRAFLAAGGRLILSGQNILESLSDSAFARDVLQARFAGNTADHLLNPESSNSLVGDYTFLYTSGSNGARNQQSSDILEIIGDAQAFAYYDTSTNQVAGLFADHVLGNGRLVFCGFGLEALSTPPNRDDFISREQFLHYAIDWLAGEQVVSVEEPRQSERQTTPLQPGLLEVYPNPVRISHIDAVTLRYRLPGSILQARLRLFDLLGREIRSINLSAAEGLQGDFTLFSGLDRQLASGVYFIVLETKELTLRTKFLVLR